MGTSLSFMSTTAGRFAVCAIAQPPWLVSRMTCLVSGDSVTKTERLSKTHRRRASGRILPAAQDGDDQVFGDLDPRSRWGGLPEAIKPRPAAWRKTRAGRIDQLEVGAHL